MKPMRGALGLCLYLSFHSYAVLDSQSAPCNCLKCSAQACLHPHAGLGCNVRLGHCRTWDDNSSQNALFLKVMYVTPVTLHGSNARAISCTIGQSQKLLASMETYLQTPLLLRGGGSRRQKEAKSPADKAGGPMTGSHDGMLQNVAVAMDSNSDPCRRQNDTNDVYLHVDSKQGDDESGDGSSSMPYASIFFALSRAITTYRTCTILLLQGQTYSGRRCGAAIAFLDALLHPILSTLLC